MFWLDAQKLTLKQVSGQSGLSSSRTHKVGQDCVHVQGHVIMNSQVGGLHLGVKKQSGTLVSSKGRRGERRTQGSPGARATLPATPETRTQGG